MTLITNHLKILTFLLLFFSGGKILYIQGQNTISDSTSHYTNQIEQARQQAKKHPSKSYQLFHKSYLYFKEQKDTTKIVVCLVNMSDITREKGKFSITFDHLWEAQYLTRNTQDKNEKSFVLIQIARLYQDFNMNNEALKHLQEALRIAKNIHSKNEKDVTNLNGCYMNLAVRERKMGNYQQALNYLDSCIYFYDSSIEMPFWDAERGHLMTKLGELKKASNYLNAAKKNAVPLNASYSANIYMYLGELKMATSEPDSAIFYFNKGLEFIEENHFGNILTPQILMNLSEVYVSLGQINTAYDYLSQSKTVADVLIQQKNTTNSELFEIKNSYLESINQRDELLEKQSIVLKQNKQIQLRLKIILALVLLLGVVIFGIIRMRLKLKRTLLDKKETELSSKIAEEQNQIKLEAKSKELTSYALQLIDKDSAIDELLKALGEESPAIYKGLNNKYKKGSKDLWDEFNLRFTEVNSAFYDRLKSQHPNLSITEQKHCALIKLNFSTKEMARILNIETHSVHMSRSRIRKKIGLERSESLENYISQL